MDPQATWNALIEKWQECDWQEVSLLSEALLDWLNKGGFPPETMSDWRMGADWNRTLALAICTFAWERATNVLESPNGIPPGIPFTLSCDNCGNDGPDSFAEAVSEGWSDLRYTPSGLSENFLGFCPICQLEENPAEKEISTPD